MKNKLKVLVVSSEMTPYAKAGGLADVTAALSSHLLRRGHDARVVMPFYACVKERAHVKSRSSMGVWMGNCQEWCAVAHTTDGCGVPVYFVEHDRFFSRPGLYHDEWMNDYLDNPDRFGLLCRAALQHCIDTGFSPDVVHANDWQTALAPAYLKLWFWNSPALGRAASVLTIHNIAYQGVYPASHRAYLGLGDQAFTADGFESFGQVCLLKGGIYYADEVNTVSPNHAREITTSHGGFGLAPYLSNKGVHFRGLLNGADYDHWSPDKDGLIPARFTAKNQRGKAVCKRELQRAFCLDENPTVCVIGAISRLVEQKGFHLVREVIERVLENMQVQFVILGSGDNRMESYFGGLPVRYSGRAGSYIGYDNNRAHLIEAGSDFFLMPSLFEPCGLNQLYSLRYGTLPIVRATGGLDDTVEQYDERAGRGTGFKFWDANPSALYYTIGWAVSTYYDRPHHMKAMIQQAMKKNFSWQRAVADYEKLYETAIHTKREYDRQHRL